MGESKSLCVCVCVCFAVLFLLTKWLAPLILVTLKGQLYFRRMIPKHQCRTTPAMETYTSKDNDKPVDLKY